jgi:hypothetical protein
MTVYSKANKQGHMTMTVYSKATTRRTDSWNNLSETDVKIVDAFAELATCFYKQAQAAVLNSDSPDDVHRLVSQSRTYLRKSGKYRAAAMAANAEKERQ